MPGASRLWALALLVSFYLPVDGHAGEPEADANGFRIHPLQSPYQAKAVDVRVLLPNEFDKTKEYRILYVLPVIPQNDWTYGDGLLEVKKLDVHNKHQLICVAPQFAAKPWYVDRPENNRKDETHLLRVVLPFIEKTYPTQRDAEGRLLVGFSKSGRGAMQLLLRHPEVFHKAAAWDSGLQIDVGDVSPEAHRSFVKSVFANEETFQQYNLVRLIKENAGKLGDRERILLYNCQGGNHSAARKIHELMVEKKLPHKYIDQSAFRHVWGSGWLPEAIAFLVE